MNAQTSATQSESRGRPGNAEGDLLIRVKAIVRGQSALAERARLMAELLSEEYRAPYVHVQLQTASRSFQHEVVQGNLPGSVWKPFADSVGIEAIAANEPVFDRLKDEASGVEAVVCGLPIRDWSDEAIGSLAIIFACESDKMARVISRQLQAVLSLLAVPTGDTAEGASETQAAQNAAVEQVALRYASFDQMAIAIVNGLKNRYAFAEVALGMVRGHRVRVTTISGRAKFHRGAPGVTQIQQAFEECLDAGKSLCSHPELDERFETRRRYVLHEQWSQAGGNCPVITVPLRDGERIVAVIGFRLEEVDSILALPVEELESKLAPLGPGILLADRLHRPWYKVAWHHALTRVGGAGRFQQALLLVAALFAVAVMIWGITPHPYIEAVQGEVGNEHRLVFAAPYPAVLDKVLVRPGDRVEQGEMLFALDVDNLETQLEEATAQGELARIERARALALGEPAFAAEAHAKYEAALAESDLLRDRIESAIVVARRGGIVVGDDARTRVGEEINQGDTVVEVAPDGSLSLKLRIPETLIQEVAVGCRGTFASMARPDEQLPFEVVSIERAAQAIDGKTVYLAEARFDDGDRIPLLGTTGTARLELGERTGAWLLWHSPMRYLRNQVNQL
ncbi:MAG: HlyD family efflux transporter periplasmic adaptor subunit [Planctomycetales bacterium]|nr:HlyD family efflux transporter periplasmic adaptor subunit [Planctomycetales bacterium]